MKQRSGIIKSGDAIVHTGYVFLETAKLGEFRFGYTNSAADKFTIGGNNLLVACEGPGSSNFRPFYSTSAGALVGAGCALDDLQAPKIAWYSPTVKGITLAASYTFNGRYARPFKSRHVSDDCYGGACWDYGGSYGYSKRVLTLAAKYEYGTKKAFNATVSVGGWFGQGYSGVPNLQMRNVRAYQVGFSGGYKDFKIAFGFVDNGKSLLPIGYAVGEAAPFDANTNYNVQNPEIGVKHGADAGKVYTYGVSYKFDKLVVSAAYLRSAVDYSYDHRERASGSAISIGCEYYFDKARSVYAEYDHIRTSTCNRARTFRKACSLSSNPDNKAKMFMVGFKFVF
jgi:predicted porin